VLDTPFYAPLRSYNPEASAPLLGLICCDDTPNRFCQRKCTLDIAATCSVYSEDLMLFHQPATVLNLYLPSHQGNT
jgi:hypothetical protein